MPYGFKLFLGQANSSHGTQSNGRQDIGSMRDSYMLLTGAGTYSRHHATGTTLNWQDMYGATLIRLRQTPLSCVSKLV
eukprot:scaffold583692_cov39-Prasinocladus_malaysianus.AAC.1